MVRVDQILFKNLPRHVDIPMDLDIHLYAVNGNLYTRKGKESPRLVAGLIIVEGTGSGGGALNTRSGREMLDTGSHLILFKTSIGAAWPLGTTGNDYNIFFDVYDLDNALPSWSITNRSKYGFYVTVYDNNINFGWKAELNTQ
jgi:hypothetical protein